MNFTLWSVLLKMSWLSRQTSYISLHVTWLILAQAGTAHWDFTLIDNWNSVAWRWSAASTRDGCLLFFFFRTLRASMQLVSIPEHLHCGTQGGMSSGSFAWGRTELSKPLFQVWRNSWLICVCSPKIVIIFFFRTPGTCYWLWKKY